MDGGTGTHVAFRIANGTRDDHTYTDGEASRTAGAYAPVMKPIHLVSRAIAYPPNHFANHDFFGFCGIGVITGKPCKTALPQMLPMRSAVAVPAQRTSVL